MEFAPKLQDCDTSGTRIRGGWLLAFAVWSGALLYQLWPSFRWQLEYFKNPGEAFFYGILIVVPCVVLGALAYSRLRGPRLLFWEPVLLATPLLLLVFRQPWAAVTTMLLVSSAAAVGRLVLKRLGLAGNSETEEGTLIVLTGFSVCAWLLALAAMAGLLSRPILWLFAVVPAAWALPRMPELWRALQRAQSAWANDEQVRSSLAGMLIPFLALALLSGVLVAVTPPVVHDGINFHLPLAQKWVETGSLIPSTSHPYSFYPQIYEVLLAWAFAIGGAAGSKALSFVLSMLGMATCWRVVRMLGGSRLAAVAALAVVSSAPALHWMASVLKNDFLMATFQVASMACLLQWRATGNFRWVLFGCWLLGMSFGVKHTALFGGFALGLLILSTIWKQQRRGVALVAVAIIIASTASIWHWRAYRITGDPAYPSESRIASRMVSIDERKANGPIERTVRAIRYVHGNSDEHVFESILPAPAGTLFSFLLPLLFFTRGGPRYRDRRMVGIVVALAMSYWLMTVLNLRYALAPLLLLACLLGIALARTYSRETPVVRTMLLALVTYSMVFGWTATLLIENSGPQLQSALGLIEDDEYKQSVHPSVAAIQHLGTLTTPEDRVLAIGCCTPFYYPTSWHFDCADTSTPRQIRDIVSMMLNETDYDYVIGPNRLVTRILGAKDEANLLYEDRSCAVRKLSFDPIQQEPSP